MNKYKKDNDFLKNRIDALEIEKQEIISKQLNNSGLIETGHHDDLAEMDGTDANDLASKEEQLLDLQDEIRLLQKNNQLLIAGQTTDKQEIFQKVNDAE